MDLFSYLRAWTILSKNGYTLESDEDGFTLITDTICLIILCGSFSAAFLNGLIESHGFYGFEPFPLYFRQENPILRMGTIADKFPLFLNSFSGLSGYDLDLEVLKQFHSTLIFSSDDYDLERYRVAFKLLKYPSIPSQFVLFRDSNGQCVIDMGCDTDAAFYRVIYISSEVLLPVWRDFILARKLVWGLGDGRLYLTNAFSCSLGLPPNHRILGVTMDLKFENWRCPASAMIRKPFFTSNAAVQASDCARRIFSTFSNEEWEYASVDFCLPQREQV